MRRDSEHPPPPVHRGCDSETEHKKHKQSANVQFPILNSHPMRIGNWELNIGGLLVLFVSGFFVQFQISNFFLFGDYFTPAAGFRTRRLNSCSSRCAKITSNNSWSGEFFPCSLKVRVSLVQGLE